MAGVVDEHGQQWERCNGCSEWVKIQKLEYEQPSERYPYGRDLCFTCAMKVVLNGGSVQGRSNQDYMTK